MGRSATRQGGGGRGGQRRTGSDRDRRRPGPQPGRADDHRQRAARAPSATSRSELPDRAVASSASWSTPAAGCAPARCWRSSTARSRRSRPPSSRRRSRRRAPMPRSRNPTTSARSRFRAAGSCPRRRSIRRRRRAMRPMPRFAWPRPSSPRPRAEIGRLNVVAPASGLILARSVEVGQIVGPGSRRAVPARRRRPDGNARAARRSRTSPWCTSECRRASRRSARTAASRARSGRSRR